METRCPRLFILACTLATCLEQLRDVASAAPEGTADRALAGALWSGCAMLVRTASIVQNLVIDVNVWDEEDFCHTTYGVPLSLFNDSGDEIEEGCVRANAALMACSDIEDRRGLCYVGIHLKLRREYLAAIEAMARGKSADARKSLATAAECARELSKHAALDSGSEYGFDYLLNHSLLVPTPPRKVSVASPKDALETFASNIAALEKVCDIDRCATLDDLRHAMLSASPLSLSIVPRSLLW